MGKIKGAPRVDRETGYQKYLTDGEFERIRDFVENRMKKSPPTRMVFFVQMYTGLRLGEVVNLKRSNFSRDFKRLTFMPLKKHKPVVHERLLPKVLQQKLKKYNQRFVYHYRDGYMFPPWRNQSKNKHITKNTVYDWWKRIRRELGCTDVYYTRVDGKPLHRVSSHTLRHYAAWRFYNASGNDIKAVQMILCHKNFETTARYIHALAGKNAEEKIVEAAFSSSATGPC